MKRHWSIAVLLVLAVILQALPAVAQESTKPAPKAESEGQDSGKSAPAAGESSPAPLDPAEAAGIKIAPVVGEKVEIQVRPGVVMKGVVKDHRCEVLGPDGSYVAVESEEVPSAGIRVYYALGLDGFIFLRYDSISEITFHGKLSQEEGLALARRIAAEMERAAEEKKRAVEEMEERRRRIAEEKAAKAGAGEETAAVEELEVESKRAAEIKGLLERFPPPEWRPARLGELKKRALILDILPNDEEKAFIDNYELWFEGYEIWRKAQEELGTSAEPAGKK